jgi:hypothetical protein
VIALYRAEVARGFLDGPADHGHGVTDSGIGGADVRSIPIGRVNPKGREQANAQYDHDTHSLDTAKLSSPMSTGAWAANPNLRPHRQPH